MRRILPLLLLATAAHADKAPALPKAVPLPAAGFHASGDIKHADFDRVALNGHTIVDGTVYRQLLKYDGKPDPTPDFVPVLERDGWTVLQKGGAVVAKKTVDGKELYVRADNAGLAVVEVHPAPDFALARPGATIEDVKKDEPPPYLIPPPRARLGYWKELDGAQLDVGALDKDVKFVGPPVLKMEWTAPGISAFEVQQTYAAALAKAGWKLAPGGVGGAVLAHFSSDGRDLWLSVSGSEDHLVAQVADVGAAAQAAKLKAQLDRDGHVAIYGIYFDTDKATLRPDADAALRQILDLLGKYAALKVEIQGHTDNTGDRGHNQQLSDARAASVKAWLVAHRIDGARLTTKGYADTRPVADNGRPEGRARNRRVELFKP